MTLAECYSKGIKLSFNELFNVGFASVERMTYFRYNIVFQAYRDKGMSRNQAYDYASDECGCSKRTMIKAVKAVNIEVKI